MKGLKWLRILGGVILLLVLASLGLRAVQERGIAGKLAKLRQRGHPTTMAELNAWYVAVPAESNAAVGVLAAMEMFPSVVPDKLPIIGPNAARVEAFEPWSADATSLAADFVSSNAHAYAALGKSLRLPASRYPITFSLSSSLDHLSQIKGAAQKLALAAQLAAAGGNSVEATEGIVNGFRLARTLDPEPIFISALVRRACSMIAAYSCERIVNQVDLADNQLSLIQDQIYSALATNVWARALVGEAAYGLEGFTMMPLEMAELWFAEANPRFPPESPRTLEYTLYSWSGLEATDRECYLDTMIQMQAAAKEELPRRLTLASNIAYEVSGGTNRMPFVKSLTRTLIPSIADGFYRDARSTATLRCGLAALAVERFRIAHDGKLPSALAELVPRYLAAVPSDPYDGKPLRFRPLAKGFVVYSLGEDGDDDGGRPRKSGQKTIGDYDVTFRIER